MSEWIKHTGTTNPVPDTVVEVYINDGSSFVENSDNIDWALRGNGLVVFYRVVNVNNTSSTESISKDTLKLVLTNALKNRKSIDSLYADLIELL